MPSEPIIYSRAHYGDGQDAQRVSANVQLDERGLVFKIPGQEAAIWPLASLRVATPIRARSTDAVLMAQGAGRASLYIDDTSLLANLIKRAPQLTLKAERWRALRPGLAAGAAAFATYAAVWILDLSPSRGIASKMPVQARQALGEQVIKTLPANGRCTDADGRRALDKLVKRLMPNGPVNSDAVVVLDWAVINAFAVPGQRIILTRQIIDEARSADEIAAIIGHEAGHAVELHPEAGLVRSVGFWALIQMVFTGTPGAIGNIGSVLAQLGYTRSAEREADEHALKLLREAGISQKGMVEFFKRMAARETRDGKPSKTDAQKRGSSDILASHPPTADRISMIESRPSYASTPALADEDWAALKGICMTQAQRTAAVASAAAKRAAEAKAVEDAKTAAEKLVAAAAAAEKAAQEKARAEQEALEAKRVAEAKRIADAKAAETPPDPKLEAASKRVQDDAADAGAYFERGQIFAGKRQFSEAIKDFDRVLELRAGDVPTLFWRAAQYGQLKQFDEAVKDYSEILRQQPKNYAALNNRGSVYRTQKKLDLAVADFTAAIAIDNKQPTALLNRALSHRDRNELDAAIVDLSAIIAANPKSASALVRRGETHELKANKEAAIADYRAVLKLAEGTSTQSEPHKTALARLNALGVAP